MKKEDSDDDWGWWCGGACTRGKMCLVPKGKGACPRNSRWRQLGPGAGGSVGACMEVRGSFVCACTVET